MEEFLKKDFIKLLKKGALDSRRWMSVTDSSTCRVYDKNLEALNLTIDFYERFLKVVDYQDYERKDDEIEEIIDTLHRYLYIEKENIIYKIRKKRTNREQHEKGSEELKLSVKENGLSFEVELMLYEDTGLFLDQALTRSLVRDNSFGKKVLNLFSYTGSFSVYAADGGAERVVSVDLSNVYCQWAKRNLENNGYLDEKKYQVITKDAYQYLRAAKKEKEKFDIVIFDPPSFSNSHKAETFDVQKDYLYFLILIFELLVDDGVVFFSENLKTFIFEKNKLSKAYEIEELTSDLCAPGFSKKKNKLRVWLLRKKKSGYFPKEKKRMDEEKDSKTFKRLKLRTTETKNEDSEVKGKLSEDKEEILKSERREKKAPKAYTFSEINEKNLEREKYSWMERGSKEKKYSREPSSRSNKSSNYEREDRRNIGTARFYRQKDKFSQNSPYIKDRDVERSSRASVRKEREDYTYPSRFQRDTFPSRDNARCFQKDRSEKSYENGRSSFSRERNFEKKDDFRYREKDERYFKGEHKREFSKNENTKDKGEERERKKKTGPKPFGYDAFMSTKNREKATAFWLQGQEGKEKKDEN